MRPSTVARPAAQVLSDALAAAEAVSGEGHPRVALVLLELGRLYARTARVSYAEGLYRCDSWCQARDSQETATRMRFCARAARVGHTEGLYRCRLSHQG